MVFRMSRNNLLVSMWTVADNLIRQKRMLISMYPDSPQYIIAKHWVGCIDPWLWFKLSAIMFGYFKKGLTVLTVTCIVGDTFLLLLFFHNFSFFLLGISIFMEGMTTLNSVHRILVNNFTKVSEHLASETNSIYFRR